MARIKIEDLPVHQEMGPQQMQGVGGGLSGGETFQSDGGSSTSLPGNRTVSGLQSKSSPGGASLGIIAILIG